MPLPLSFKNDGLASVPAARFKRLLIGTEGAANTGKSEFCLSAPGPAVFMALDRSYEAMLDNQEPPVGRQPLDNYAIIPVRVPLVTQANQTQFQAYWKDFHVLYLKALDNRDARTVIVDGDSDGFELQTLAEFGKLTQIPPILRTTLNAARRAYIARSFDSGKIIIHTNKLKKKYETVYLETGAPKVGTDGKEIREWDGVSYERQGFWDHEYCYQIQLKHLYKPAGVNRITKKETQQQWGIFIQMCKANRALEGTELWGDDCNLQSLLQLVYPQVPLEAWGY